MKSTHGETRGPAPSNIPTDDEIRRILVERIDVRHQSVGIVVGVIDGNGRRVVAYGRPAKDDPQSPNGDTVFEIGSITKVFTKLLLADMAHRGDVSFDDPIATYLPPEVTVPERNGRAITLIDLATHTSGLPRDPDDITPAYSNPYADYTVERLYRFLSRYTLTRDIGSEGVYSNLGFGLLGQALAGKAGTDYESLVHSRICAPLGMNDTRITFTPEMKGRLATGHDPGLTPIQNWYFPAFEGAAALRSTTNNLLNLLSANLGFTTSALAPAIADAQTRRRSPTRQANMEVSLGWGISTDNGKEIFWHSGGTGGYCSWLGFDPGARAGVVVLSNTGWLVNDIGRHLLDPAFPLAEPHSEHREVRIDTGLYDYYVGSYQPGPDFILTVSREGDRLFARATGMAKYEIFPESERDYFYKVMDAQIRFVTGESGYADEIIFTVDRMADNLKRTE